MCSKVLQPGSLVVIFETLLSSAATTVDEQAPEEIERIMAGVEAYLSIRRHIFYSRFSFFEVDGESGKDPSEKDFLEDLWDRIQVLSNNGWKVDSVNGTSSQIRIYKGKTCFHMRVLDAVTRKHSSLPSGILGRMFWRHWSKLKLQRLQSNAPSHRFKQLLLLHTLFI